MRSKMMLGTAVAATIAAVGVFATDSEAAGFRGGVRPAAYRPAFRPPAYGFRRPMPNVRAPVRTTSVQARLPPRTLRTSAVHSLSPAHHPLPQQRHPEIRPGPIPGVYGRDRRVIERDLRHDRDDHRFAHEWTRPWWDRDFRARFFDRFGRWGQHGWGYLDAFHFGHHDVFAFHHVRDHLWHTMWDHGFAPFGEGAWRHLAHHHWHPWWDRWVPAAPSRVVVTGRPYFGVLGGGAAGVGGGGDNGDAGGDNGGDGGN
jgi:hypothetical protein